MDHPELGRVNVPHTPLSIVGLSRIPLQPSLPLGAMNDEIYGNWLGLSREEMDQMAKDGVI
jgi:crotonobetainyl-CoA:carnitine CoA-transferase CaiB-like acyl-CoA transferase